MCGRCEDINPEIGRPPSECHPERRHYSHGLCKHCYERDWQKTPVGKAKEARRWEKRRRDPRYVKTLRPRYFHTSKLRCKYNMTPDEYDALLLAQNGVCAICKKVQIDGRRLAVDHEHSTNTVRGLLCTNCNRGLGYMKDSLKNLENAICYLNRHEERRAIKDIIDQED